MIILASSLSLVNFFFKFTSPRCLCLCLCACGTLYFNLVLQICHQKDAEKGAKFIAEHGYIGAFAILNQTDVPTIRPESLVQRLVKYVHGCSFPLS